MTGNATENPERWAEDWPPGRYLRLDIADEEGSWLLLSAEEVGADV